MDWLKDKLDFDSGNKDEKGSTLQEKNEAEVGSTLAKINSDDILNEDDIREATSYRPIKDVPVQEGSPYKQNSDIIISDGAIQLKVPAEKENQSRVENKESAKQEKPSESVPTIIDLDDNPYGKQFWD